MYITPVPPTSQPPFFDLHISRSRSITRKEQCHQVLSCILDSAAQRYLPTYLPTYLQIHLPRPPFHIALVEFPGFILPPLPILTSPVSYLSSYYKPLTSRCSVSISMFISSRHSQMPAAAKSPPPRVGVYVPSGSSINPDTGKDDGHACPTREMP